VVVVVWWPCQRAFSRAVGTACGSEFGAKFPKPRVGTDPEMILEAGRGCEWFNLSIPCKSGSPANDKANQEQNS
jgi:hypothetical protein